MKSITIRVFLVMPILCAFISICSAQYSAVELNVGLSRYLDDNLDREYDYSYQSVRGLAQYNLGYAFPISEKILLTPKVGIAFAKENYIRNTPSAFMFVDGDFTLEKNNTLLYTRTGIEFSYWFKPDFSGFFFVGELNAAYLLSANTERITRVYDSSEMRFFDLPIENNSIRDQFHTIVPTTRLGIGYNFNMLSNFNIFASTHLEYRPTGYYKNTENITHFSRTLNLGIKYVIKGGTSILKKRKKEGSKE